jgi:hypothetical protein
MHAKSNLTEDQLGFQVLN